MNKRHGWWLLALVTLAWLTMPYASAMAQSCGTFQQVPTPDPDTANDTLSHLAALSDGTAWAVGSQAGTPTVPLLLYFDGNTWSSQPLPAEAEGMHFGASCSTPDGDVWLAGTRTYTVYEVEVIFLRARGGVIDRVDHVFNPRAPIAMSATSATDVWALTGDGDVMHFDGSDWTETDVPAPFSTLMYARGIYAADPNDVWAVGYGGNQKGQYIGYAQHWDGSSWTTVSTPFDGQNVTFFRDIDGSAADDVWIVGYINYSQTIALHWDGSSWTQYPGPPSDAPFLQVAVLAPDDAWATPYSLSDYDVLYHWDGGAWSEILPLEGPDASPVRWVGLAKAGPCDLWTTGSYFIDPSYHMLVARLRPEEDAIVDVPDVTMTGSTAFALKAPQPTPFRSRTTIAFDVPRAVRASVSIYDLSGRLVRTLVEDRELAPGSYAPSWGGTDASGRKVAPGVYFVRFESAEFSGTRKVMRLR